ncbi:MAG: Hpt domain-containing protein [Treponema sp.]|nr:Hpt domain-containing protein [Treponema sp.]
MIDLNVLREFGADVDAGLARCLKKEDFYYKMLNICLSDERFEKLKGLLESKDYDAAFETAHALKGVLANLGLTPIYEPISQMTEFLRARTDMDYMPLYGQMKAQYDKLLSYK